MSKSPQAGFFGHPRGLATLFFTELWERFSYYGMRGILVLFMIAAVKNHGFGMDSTTATAIYGLYTASVYLLALPGGWIADRILGQRRAVFLGGCIIAAGHFSMAIPVGSAFFYLGLILIVVGTGLLKPNVSAIVGGLYEGESGARRDAGFSIFYMGINLGALLGPLVCGYLGEKINWHLGFSAAGIGMVLGLIQYRLGVSNLRGLGELPLDQKAGAKGALHQLLMGCLAVLAIIAALVVSIQTGLVSWTVKDVAEGLGYVMALLGIFYFLAIFIFAKLEPVEKKRVFVIFMMFLGAAVFWGGFEQAGTSMNIFGKYLTDRTVFGWTAPASWLQSVNPVFIIALAPVFGWLWVALRRWNPSLPLKFAYGLILLGAGFMVMKWAALQAVQDSVVTLIKGTDQVSLSSNAAPTLVSPVWLISTYFLHTCGELCLSPIGLSSVTKLAPKRLVSQMMGTWFLGAALGNLVAGLVAGHVESIPMAQIFGSVALIGGGVGVLFVLLMQPIKKMMGGVD